MKIKLTCLTGGDQPQTSFSGMLFVENEADIQINANGVSVKGRQVALSQAKVNSPSCPYLTYEASERFWNLLTKEWDYRTVTKTRTFNAIATAPKGSITYFVCAVGSELEIYDNADSWISDLYKAHGRSIVASADCMIP
jgi:hypothetical protein